MAGNVVAGLRKDVGQNVTVEDLRTPLPQRELSWSAYPHQIGGMHLWLENENSSIPARTSATFVETSQDSSRRATMSVAPCLQTSVERPRLSRNPVKAIKATADQRARRVAPKRLQRKDKALAGFG
jgi:hypothetical protein